MPIRIRWNSKENLGLGFLLLGMCGIIQLFFIFIGQYFLAIGNYFVVILIPIGITVATFFATLIIFESYAQIERREKLRTQFHKSKINVNKLKKILNFPISKPILIVFTVFTSFFFITFFISILFLDNTFSFIIAENVSAVVCLLIASLLEKTIGKVQRY
ncbi:MAG: hypothetical protein ACXAAH_03220 [Promethearchaeota archaeon]|jgi:hypothetical protein